MMFRFASLGLAAILALPVLALAQDLDDRHLPVLPRTAKEQARISAVTAPATDFTAPEKFETKPGGAATVRARDSSDAFSLSSANMPFAREMDFKLGNGLFRKTWVAAPSSTKASDGLGPLHNARGCQDCHLKDGRGHVPAPGGAAVSMFLRLSIPGSGAVESLNAASATAVLLAQWARNRAGATRPR